MSVFPSLPDTGFAVHLVADAQADGAGDAEARLRAILSGSGAAAAWEWDVARRTVRGDAAFAALYGLDPAEAAAGVAARLFFSAIHPLDRDRIRLAIGGMLRGVELLSKEFRVVAPSGAIRWVHARGRAREAAHAAQERPTSLYGVLIDITEQKRLEEQLRFAQTAGGVGTFEHVAGFGTASVSAQFCRLLGVHPTSDLPVLTINSVVHPGDPPLIDPGPPPAGGGMDRTELRIVRRDSGEVRWLTRRAEYVRDSDTSSLRFTGVIYDVTDAKRVEEKLRVLNETLESQVAERTRERDRIWRVSHDLLGVADRDGRWISINPAWDALLGWAEADIVGRTLEWLEHPDDARSFSRELRQSSGGLRQFGLEGRLRDRHGGYRWLDWTAVPEDDRLYCVGRDVTAQKQAAEALARAEEQLRQSQKMEAVGQLTGGLAHDFNNLMTSIAGSLELIQIRTARDPGANVDRYLAAARAACDRAAALTHRLLAFARRQTLTPRPTDISRLVAGLEELIRRTMGPSVGVGVSAVEELWTTIVDPNQLENALLNLCINARDAMPRGGRLAIELANRTLAARDAEERNIQPGDYVTLTVTDTGTGMSAEVAARAFDPFFTTKPLGQGTGLGLSMVYGFARQSGGMACIRSRPDDGTTVRLYLPRHAGQAAEPDDTALATAPAPASRRRSILVVDDEPSIRLLVAEVLDDLDYAVTQAEDAAGALRVLRSGAPIDLLLTDVGLPGGMNGRQLADATRALRPGLAVLFMTGYADTAVLQRLDGGMDVITKPFQMNDLAARVADIVADH